MTNSKIFELLQKKLDRWNDEADRLEKKIKNRDYEQGEDFLTEHSHHSRIVGKINAANEIMEDLKFLSYKD